MHAGFRPRFAIYQNAGNTYWTRSARSISPRLVRFGVPSATAWRRDTACTYIELASATAGERRMLDATHHHAA